MGNSFRAVAFPERFGSHIVPASGRSPSFAKRRRNQSWEMERSACVFHDSSFPLASQPTCPVSEASAPSQRWGMNQCRHPLPPGAFTRCRGNLLAHIEAFMLKQVLPQLCARHKRPPPPAPTVCVRPHIPCLSHFKGGCWVPAAALVWGGVACTGCFSCSNSLLPSTSTPWAGNTKEAQRGH